MTSSCRIDLIDQAGRGCRLGCPVRVISRTQPAAMTGHMTPSAWLSFCDKIDAELRPLNSARPMLAVWTCLCFATYIGVIIAMTVGEPFSFSRSRPVLVIIASCMSVGMIVISCVAGFNVRSAMSRAEAVCAETSTRYSVLSFHVRYEDHHVCTTQCAHYIEASIAAPTRVCAATAVDVGGKSPAARLAELEEMKTMLSTEEYEAKQRDITEEV